MHQVSLNQRVSLKNSLFGECMCVQVRVTRVCSIKRLDTRAKVVTFPAELEVATEPPINLFKPKVPYIAKIVSVERIVGAKAPGETCHIVIDHGGNVPYWEGQSYGVIAPVSLYLSSL